MHVEIDGTGSLGGMMREIMGRNGIKVDEGKGLKEPVRENEGKSQPFGVSSTKSCRRGRRT